LVEEEKRVEEKRKENERKKVRGWGDNRRTRIVEQSEGESKAVKVAL